MWIWTFRAHIAFALCGHVLFAKLCSMLAPQVAGRKAARGAKGIGVQ